MRCRTWSCLAGLDRARAATGDRAAADPAWFLAVAIERFYNTPEPVDRNDDARLKALLAHLAAASQAPGPDAAPTPTEEVPLPLTPEWWSSVVFGNRVPADRLVPAILGSRDAALLYRALLTLDTPTRLWFGDRS